MKITVTGSLGNISKTLVERMIKENHNVSVITSNPENVQLIEKLAAKALLGKLDDEVFVKKAFKDADAVYTMIPPSYGTTEEIKKVGDIYVKAITENKIPFVVNLSGIGAHLENGPGPSGANHYNEKKMNAIEETNVLHLRPGMFYSNFYGSVDLVKQQHVIGNNFDENVVLALSHPQDIARIAFDALHTQNFKGKIYKYVVSAEISGKQIAEKLGNAIQMPGLKWVQFPDAAMFQSLMQQGLSPQMATTYIIDMGIALREGKLMATYFKEKDEHLAGKISFDDFAKEFAFVYQSK